MEITSRLKLRKPALTDPEEEDDYNFNYDVLDNNPGWTICTSSTRPTANLFLRQMIFETDTKRIYAYSGVVGEEWVPVSPVPAAQMTRNAAGAGLPAGPIWVTLDMDAAVFDNYGICNIANNTFDIPFTGLWYFDLHWLINTSYPGLMIACRIVKSGNQSLAQTDTLVPNNPGRGITTQTSAIAKINKGEQIWADGYNNYGGAVSILNGAHFIQFNAYFIGDQ